MSAEESNVIELQPHSQTVDRMAAELLRALVDEVKHAQAQWSKLSESQQDMLIARLRSTVRVETEKAVQLIAKGSREAARVKIESLTAKEGVKCVLSLVNDSAHDVLDYVGKPAVLVMCNPEQFFSGVEDVKADKDQAELPLGEGGPAEADTAPGLTADVEVGDEVRFRSEGPDAVARKVRAVHRDVDPPEIEVTGMDQRFAIDLFWAANTDPLAEVEAEDAAEREEGADDEERLTVDVDDEEGDE